MCHWGTRLRVSRNNAIKTSNYLLISSFLYFNSKSLTETFQSLFNSIQNISVSQVKCQTLSDEYQIPGY